MTGKVSRAEINKEFNDFLDSLNLQIAELKNKKLEILSFTSNNDFVIEKGTTINDITLGWELSKNPTILKIDDKVIAEDLRSTVLTGVNLTDTTKYTLYVTDEDGITVSKELKIEFGNGIYFGSSSVTTNDIDLLDSVTKILTNDKFMKFTVDAGADDFIVFAIPSRLGECVFEVNGIEGGIHQVDTKTITNSKNFSETYKIYKSTNKALGLTTVTVKQPISTIGYIVEE